MNWLPIQELPEWKKNSHGSAYLGNMKMKPADFGKWCQHCFQTCVWFGTSTPSIKNQIKCVKRSPVGCVDKLDGDRSRGDGDRSRSLHGSRRCVVIFRSIDRSSGGGDVRFFAYGSCDVSLQIIATVTVLSGGNVLLLTTTRCVLSSPSPQSWTFIINHHCHHHDHHHSHHHSLWFNQWINELSN